MIHSMKTHNRILLATLLLFMLTGHGHTAQLQTSDFRLSLSPRAPEGIAAFYEARGFPAKAVELLQQQCYIGVLFHNTSKGIIWVELENWQFSTAAGPHPRLDRAYWKQRWQKEKLEPRFQSTFRWTLMPEQLDFRADEREGGNLILPYTEQPLRLTASLRILRDGKEIRMPIQLDQIKCLR